VWFLKLQHWFHMKLTPQPHSPSEIAAYHLTIILWRLNTHHHSATVLLRRYRETAGKRGGAP